MDRIEALQLFMRVADAGGFSQAARALDLTQSQVSRAVQQLEERWGARLFHRTTRVVTLTEAGERAYEHARTLLEQAEELDNALSGVDAAPAGLLRIAAPIEFALAKLSPLTGRFLDRYPKVKLDFLLSDSPVDLAAQGVDLAFQFGPLPDSTLRSRRLCTYKRMLAAAPDFLERSGTPASPEDLRSAKAILSVPIGANWELVGPNGATAVVEPRGDVRASSGPAVVDLARQGLGVAMMPCFIAYPLIERGSLAEVLPAWRGALLPLFAVWSARELPRKARLYLEFAAPHLFDD